MRTTTNRGASRRLTGFTVCVMAAMIGVGPLGHGALAQSTNEATPAGTVFRDCATICPEMVVVPAGSMTMGDPAARNKNQVPVHTVTIAKPFAVGRFEITWDEYDACVAARACPSGWNGQYTVATDHKWGKGRKPAIELPFAATQSYVKWISKKAKQPYRLLSEAEWEYMARAGTTTTFWVGDTLNASQANYLDKQPEGDFSTSGRSTVAVGSYPPNPFGIYDTIGNVWEWVQDCYESDYSKAPTNGAAYVKASCSKRVVRGGGLYDEDYYATSANRFPRSPTYLMYDLGFRVARRL